MERGRSADAANRRAQIVKGWQSVFDKTYGDSAPIAGFKGWNSCYTSQPLPEADMNEWLTNTVERIKELCPKRVLEIGCGLGLLLRQLTPECEVYVGTDFSGTAIAQAQQWVTQGENGRHVELLHRAATEFQDLASYRFDTVVLNSVAQYFPDVDYLMTVLRGAIQVLGPGGHIFVGDVRHRESQLTLHSAVQLSKAAPTLNVGQLRSHILRAVSHDNELVIDPDLFRLLVGQMPGISSAVVQLKRCKTRNELTSYRFDVSLTVGDHLQDGVACEHLQWPAALGCVSRLEAALSRRRWAAVYLSAIPNARIASDVAARRLIEMSDERVEVATLRRQLSEWSVDAVDPQAVWDLAEAYGYNAVVSPGERGSFEVQLVDRLRDHEVSRPCIDVRVATTPWRDYANTPFDSAFSSMPMPPAAGSESR